MARKFRTRAAAIAQRTPTPPVSALSDEEVIGTPLHQGSPDEEAEQDRDDSDIDDLDQDIPAVDSDNGSIETTAAQIRGADRRKRGGRRQTSTRRTDTGSQEARDIGSDAATPRKRGGWRGRGPGTGRWAKHKAGLSHATQVPIDKDGNSVNIVNDEADLPKDSEGEAKVDQDGSLLGGREYRVRTFRIEGKGNRLYMLSTEPARCIGFRDSYLFFQKHKQLHKIIIAEDAKKDLIDRGIIPHSYKGRAIGVVTARSVFREFGARIIVGGRKISDDYLVSEARSRGDVEGDFAVPEDDLPANSEVYDRNRYVAWHGASSVYHTNAPSVPLVNGKPFESKKRKVAVTGANWMYEHALQASGFNSRIGHQRRQCAGGVYNIHTNYMQLPRNMQPTRARWEQIDAEDTHRPNVQISESHHDGLKPTTNPSTLFSPLPRFYAQQFLIADLYLENPSMRAAEKSQNVEGSHRSSPSTLPQITDDVLAVLPDDCRLQVLEAGAQAEAWRGRWMRENVDSIAKLKVTYNA